MPEMLYDHIVVRYGELSTKGKNRKEFTRQLTNNIKKRLQDHKALTYNTLHDGLFIKLNGEDYPSIKEELKDIFGYSYFSGAIRVNKDIEEVKKVTLALAENHNVKTFKIATKRHDKSYPMRSDEINRALAGNILHNTSLLVDVHEPDLMIYVSVDKDFIYVMDEKVRGGGGYPTGINGMAMVMMSGGIDSPVAAYMTMKRGLKIECIHFASEPYTSKQALDKVLTLAEKLSVCQEEINVHIIPFTDLQLAIYKNVDEPYCITIMRRMMYRIADQICKNRKIKVITNGESIGQVASQTPESISVIGKVADTLILRPLCMMDKLEIIDIAKRIDTYETSILPFEDCCTIFDPKNPVTKPKEDKCLHYESLFDYQPLVDACIANERIVKVSYRKEDKEDESIF
ncbi:MAG: tRNA 4-thiouridine(8) synthase ThiI [Erysipelotrichaceae bacterium]|jgi:thiamine biosynthesis protein ThiI|nr:tRNA 4-thiouridine(8) synthase ThiI [Erysipelotrichaceae bacterium]MBQ1776148.1 tRNA 4-thiouridine(8) synthase ThiI [Erysipelotrichaceae bacterium]MBQ1812298.1 tRNA 4-thiouridine(8) synthase ThiI [Erysipelotrichaceae bacterium]MBQ3994335.1 tRNA 4-thiouridine(8) synthase ThiI [Erysipelotrichaceae bacterium]